MVKKQGTPQLLKKTAKTQEASDLSSKEGGARSRRSKSQSSEPKAQVPSSGLRRSKPLVSSEPSLNPPRQKKSSSPQSSKVRKQPSHELSAGPGTPLSPQTGSLDETPVFAVANGDSLPQSDKSPQNDTPDSPVASPSDVPPSVLGDTVVNFDALGFGSETLGCIAAVGYTQATPVQQLCFPVTLKGGDLAAFAQTGTGKTAVFLLTFLQRFLDGSISKGLAKQPAGLVLVPTRELAAQISADAEKIFAGTPLKTLSVFGGTDLEKQARALELGIDLLVATPGRLFDLFGQGFVDFSNVSYFVCDECDRMFDMGFVDDVERVLKKLTAPKVQKLFFSATGSDKVKELAFQHLEKPEYIETNPEKIAPEKISQFAFAVAAQEKFRVLLGCIKEHNPPCAVVFTNTKVVAEWVAYKLSCNGINAEAFTGDVPQAKRFSMVDRIKNGKLKVLVATDVASRGLHVTGLSHVYNFDVPEEPENFVHRIGRTARAGETGTAVTLICEDYGYGMGSIETLLGFSIEIRPIPKEFLSMTDESDFPFDAQGRVKSFGRRQERDEGSEKWDDREGSPSPIAAQARPTLPPAAVPSPEKNQPTAHRGTAEVVPPVESTPHDGGGRAAEPAAASPLVHRQQEQRSPQADSQNRHRPFAKHPHQGHTHHKAPGSHREQVSGGFVDDRRGSGGHPHQPSQAVGNGPAAFTGAPSRRVVDDRAKEVAHAARAAARSLAESQKNLQSKEGHYSSALRIPVTLSQTKQNIGIVLRNGLDDILEILQKQIEDWRQRLQKT